MCLAKSQLGGKIERLVISALAKLAMIFASTALAAGVCFAQAQPQAQSQSSKHTITITFDYDFTAMRACSPKVAKKCIAKFVVYDISGKKPYKLFTIPVPADATGPVKGITGKSELLLFESGKHLLAVTAQNDSGEESSSYACSVWITIP
jgi:hypothetical protein